MIFFSVDWEVIRALKQRGDIVSFGHEAMKGQSGQHGC